MNDTIDRRGQDFDAIIIGAGHNGLACAGYLGQGGARVLVLEAAEQLGGLAANREFAPGFHSAVAHTLPQLSNRLAQDLKLHEHGFALANTALPTIALSDTGNHITLTERGLRGASEADSRSYLEYRRVLETFAGALREFWHRAPPLAGSGSLPDYRTLARFALKLRLLGKDDMRELMRVMFLPAQDLMDEYFSEPLLKAALSWDANVGNKLAPRSPNNAVINLLYKMSGDLEGAGSLPLPRGGMGVLVAALAAAAREAGAEIRSGTAVRQVIVEEQRAVGVQLENGERFFARHVISNADPKTSFLDLLGARHLDVGFTHRIHRLRNEGYVAKLHLALDRLPHFAGLDRPDGRLILAPTMGFIENAFDAAKYGGFAEQLPMEVLLPSLHDDSLAPPGKHLLSALVQYVPCHLRGGWDEGSKAQLLENVLNTLQQYAPDLPDCVLASELLTPADLQQQYRLQGGHWHHAEYALDNWWMNRPTYGASQYKTPLSGFYLCGAGSHPGGGIMGAAGANAARAVLAQER